MRRIERRRQKRYRTRRRRRVAGRSDDQESGIAENGDTQEKGEGGGTAVAPRENSGASRKTSDQRPFHDHRGNEERRSGKTRRPEAGKIHIQDQNRDGRGDEEEVEDHELGALFKAVNLTDDQVAALVEAGFDSVEAITEATDGDLQAVKGIGAATVRRLREVNLT